MKKILLIAIISSLHLTINAQLSVTAESNDTVFIYSLAGAGVTVSNLTRTCADSASGYFNSTAANVGIDSGIVLTSGSILNTLGPNSSGSAGTLNGSMGDDDLNELIPGYYTYEACVIEFDMAVLADTVRISYVFGSEEYLEYVGSGFNDIFAFWVSGPGITDTVNIATIPDTDIPVSINNLNSTSYSDYYVYNGDGFEDPYISDPFYIQYDGITAVMEGKIATMPGETYHMKIAVADAGDGIFDTGVFLKTGSLGSLRLASNYYGEGYSTMAQEKCTNGYLEFTNLAPGTADMVLDFHISGTAVNGEDYELIDNQVIIPAGFETALLPILPIEDSETEGDETIILQLYNPQSGYIYQTIELILKDGMAADYTYENTGATYMFYNSTPDTYLWDWDFGDGTTMSAEANPVHTYATGGEYNVCMTAYNTNNCQAITCKTVSVASGVYDAENILSQTSLFPNPAVGNFTITLPASVLAADVLITTLLGKEVVSYKNIKDQFEVDCSILPSGMYYVTIASGEAITVKTIQIQ